MPCGLIGTCKRCCSSLVPSGGPFPRRTRGERSTAHVAGRSVGNVPTAAPPRRWTQLTHSAGQGRTGVGTCCRPHRFATEATKSRSPEPRWHAALARRRSEHDSDEPTPPWSRLVQRKFITIPSKAVKASPGATGTGKLGQLPPSAIQMTLPSELVKPEPLPTSVPQEVGKHDVFRQALHAA